MTEQNQEKGKTEVPDDGQYIIDRERSAKIDFSVAEGFAVQVGPQFEGEPVRKGEYRVELGGPKAKNFELMLLKGMDEIEDGNVTIIGPDISEMEEGGTYPYCMVVEMAGEELEEEMESVMERRLHMYTNYMEGVWHMGSRDDIWVRIHKDAYEQGLNSFNEVAEILHELFLAEFYQIESLACTFVTDPEKMEEFMARAKAAYGERDARLVGMAEEDVEEFYSCTLCHSFAPSHVCIITPERISLCGAMNWLDGRVSYKMDPGSFIGRVEKGELLDPVNFEYAGCNKIMKEKSLGAHDRVYMHSIFGFPHTSCGCFQSIAFYIPEVDGIGIVHREFSGETPTGTTFSVMASEVGGGTQQEGFVGMGIEYMRSPKFFIAEGGFKKVVWLPKEIKERVKDSIPEDLYDKIATEEDVKDVDQLTEFLERVGHPVFS